VNYITYLEKTQAKQDKLSRKRESARQKRHYTQQALLSSTSLANFDANMSEFDANISIGSVATLSPTTQIVQQHVPHSRLLSPQFQSFYLQLGQKLPQLKVNLPTHDLRFNNQLIRPLYPQAFQGWDPTDYGDDEDEYNDAGITLIIFLIHALV